MASLSLSQNLEVKVDTKEQRNRLTSEFPNAKVPFSHEKWINIPRPFCPHLRQDTNKLPFPHPFSELDQIRGAHRGDSVFPVLCESDVGEGEPGERPEPSDCPNNDSRTAGSVGGLSHQAPLLRPVLEEQPQALLHLPGLSLGPGPLHAHELAEGGDQRLGAIQTR